MRWKDGEFIADGMAEGVGFEPTVAFTTPVFKTGLFVHSSTPPNVLTMYDEVGVVFARFGAKRRAWRCFNDAVLFSSCLE